MEIGHFAKSPRPEERAEAQCLGEMPWVSRATAMMPDHRYMARARTKVKEYAANRRCGLLAEHKSSKRWLRTVAVREIALRCIGKTEEGNPLS